MERYQIVLHFVLLVNGGLGLWSEWSGFYCGGYQFRTRACTNPAPRYGGKYCQGHSTEQTNCSITCSSSRYLQTVSSRRYLQTVVL